ncbi:organic solute transporter subunit alpha-like [Athalia rosae]|uniref:organic solute transporter subunit alpha-like n=1 Tax=Athalia rosae TaxID=37344 RepID=UPI0020337BF1|nr:organic solute transporter subunit alpha-like [Athalia rosae]
MLETVQNFTNDYEKARSIFVNRSCDWDVVPSAVDYFDSLGSYGVGLIGLGSLLTVLTFYVITDAICNVIPQKESAAYKTNSVAILLVYPVSSLCSLLATAIPRAQLLSESLTQICLAVSLYRLFLLLIDLGHRGISKPPSMALKVGPCCCWPCLPFPTVEMNKRNLVFLRMCVLQLPIIQISYCCLLLFLCAEESILAQSYGGYLQPVSLTSILFAVYGLTVATKSLQDCAPDAALPRRTMVSQMVLLFSKLQGFVVKSIPSTGVLPCHPPLTPQIYANLTYNYLMIIEMLMLAYAARNIYKKSEKHEAESGIIETRGAAKNNVGQTEVTSNNEMPNIQLPVPIAALTADGNEADSSSL